MTCAINHHQQPPFISNNHNEGRRVPTFPALSGGFVVWSCKLWVMMTGCFVLDWPWQILAWTTQWPQLRSLILAPLSESKINHFNIKCHRMIRSMPILDTPACLHNLTVIRIYRLRMTRKCRPRRKNCYHHKIWFWKVVVIYYQIMLSYLNVIFFPTYLVIFRQPCLF